MAEPPDIKPHPKLRQAKELGEQSDIHSSKRIKARYQAEQRDIETPKSRITGHQGRTTGHPITKKPKSRTSFRNTGQQQRTTGQAQCKVLGIHLSELGSPHKHA